MGVRCLISLLRLNYGRRFFIEHYVSATSLDFFRLASMSFISSHPSIIYSVRIIENVMSLFLFFSLQLLSWYKDYISIIENNLYNNCDNEIFKKDRRTGIF